MFGLHCLKGLNAGQIKSSKVGPTNPTLMGGLGLFDASAIHPEAEIIHVRAEMLQLHYLYESQRRHTFSLGDSAAAGDKSERPQTESTSIPRSNGAVSG